MITSSIVALKNMFRNTAKYNSTDPGANPAACFKWAKQLTKEVAEKITVESVLGGSDAWKPAQP